MMPAMLTMIICDHDDNRSNDTATAVLKLAIMVRTVAPVAERQLMGRMQGVLANGL